MGMEFASWVVADDRFEIVAPAPLNLVCFRHIGGDELNQRLLETINQSGDLYLTHTKLNEQYVLRLCVGQTYTEKRHVQSAWRKLQDTASSLVD